MIEFIGIIGAIALVAIGFGAIMAAAFGIKEDEVTACVLPPSAVDEEIARWQEASERTFQRQGIRRNR